MQTRLIHGLRAVLVLVAVASPASAQLLSPTLWRSKTDLVLQQRSTRPGQTRVIIRAADLAMQDALPIVTRAVGGTTGRALRGIGAIAATLPNTAIARLATNALVGHVSFDRTVGGSMERTGATVGATVARADYGVDGAGVGVAIIDSGVTAWHDDISPTGRVTRFVDFVNYAGSAYDDFGHGSHVAGIIAG